jgi:hypothetical protein
MRGVWLTLVVPVFFGGCGGCGGSSNTPIDAPRIDAIDAVPDSIDAFELTLDKTPGMYRNTCDGSGGLAIDFDHFLDVNDEEQTARLYRRAMDGMPIQELDLTEGLALNSPNDEADLEALARIDNRIFAITSHGRKASGALDEARYRFAGFNLSGTVPTLALENAGAVADLLVTIMISSNWASPNTGIITALENASGDLENPSTQPDLAPENMGTNIEGLASDGADGLWIGFRNPRPGGAIVLHLGNPNDVVEGAQPEILGSALLDLDNLGIRSMAWSAMHNAVLIVAGPHDAGGPGPFKLFKWSGVLTEAAVKVADLTVPTDASPEAIIVYPDTKDVQLLYDQGDALIGGTACKDLNDSTMRVFTDQIIRVD